MPRMDDVFFHASKPPVFNRRFDLRWNNQVLPIGDQGPAGSCTGFGTSRIEYSSMVIDKTFTTPPFHPSELWNYFIGRRDKTRDTGASISAVIDATVEHGIAPAHLWLYKPENVLVRPPKRAFEEALRFKTLKKARVPQTEKEIVNCLANGLAIVFGHWIHENFWTVKADGLVPLPRGRKQGGHCQFLAAYDLDKGLVGAPNSWGSGYGDHGWNWFTFDHILNPEYCLDLMVIYEISI